MKNYLVIDVETTIFNEGDPFDTRNELCFVGLCNSSGNKLFDIQYGSDPYGDKLEEIRKSIDEAEVLVGFNLKFDLHWLRRYIPNVDFSNKLIWDCQLVEFLLSSQRLRFPSLAGVCDFYSLGSKLDVVATEYWDHGIDTKLVPKHLLTEYLAQDLKLTNALYLKQLELVKEKSESFNKLVWLHNEDVKALEEMEFNGMKINLDAIEKLRGEVSTELAHIDTELKLLSGVPDNVPVNLASPAQLSAVLYGGYINYPSKRLKTITLKSGETKTREVNSIYSYECLGFTTPIKGSETEATLKIDQTQLNELQQQAYYEFKAIPYRKYSTDEAHLRMIKPRNKKGRDFIELLLKRSTLEQQLTTYLNKIPEMLKDHYWADNIIHGQFNQCVAKTGRLSSSKPNLQNLDSELHHLFISRYATN